LRRGEERTGEERRGEERRGEERRGDTDGDINKDMHEDHLHTSSDKCISVIEKLLRYWNKKSSTFELHTKWVYWATYIRTKLQCMKHL
jgi:hypothetical protein